MVTHARKLVKNLGAKLRKKEAENDADLFGLGAIMDHIKTNWVEVKKNVTFTSFIRNRRESI